MSRAQITGKDQDLLNELTGIRAALVFFFGSRYEEKIAPSKKILERIVQEKKIEPYCAAYYYLGWIRNRISHIEKQFVLAASLELEEERIVASRRSLVVGEELKADNCQLKTDDCIPPGGKMP
ncbi:MAG: hypothetical protein WC657_05385 [Candidatus Paceibacterota bacterium]|jgi:hypothetical protein